MIHLPLVLGLGPGEIFAIIVAILTILGGIFGQANEAKKTKERQAGKRDTSGPVTGLDSLAQRRREQLEAMARKRTGGATGGSRSGSGMVQPGRPDNMTTTQTTEREAARAAYAERAAAMREPGQLNTMLTRGEAGGQAQAGADAERAAVKTRRDARTTEDNRQGIEQRARRKQEKRRSRPKPPQLPEHREEDQRPSRHLEQLGTDVSGRHVAIAELGKGASEVDTSLHGDAYETQEVHRHVTDVSDAGAAVPNRPSRLAAMMAGRSWREVFVLKEVLDPPVTMRNAQE